MSRSEKPVAGQPVAEKPIAGVIGWPIKHSRSPLIHNHWLQRAGLGGTYIPIAVPPEELKARLDALAHEGLRGINVTVPHKQAVAALMDKTDEAARQIGAVNTVVFEKNGGFVGLNTDAKGFIASLQEAGDEWKEGPALVLGAGGAARAVVFGLLEAGVRKITILNRTPARAQGLAQDLARPGASLDVLPWENISEGMKGIRLLVNATSLGLQGGRPLVLDLAPLERSALVTDLVYAPLETDLLAAARARGNKTVDGLGMLMHQARFAFEAWFDKVPDVDEDLRQMLERDLATDP